MTREETKKIIQIITYTYPNFKPQDLTVMVNIWTEMFAETPYEKCATALKTYILSDTSGFAPSIGALNNLINTIEERAKGEELNEMQAWALVSKAIRNGVYGAEKEFNALPPLVQKAVGSAKNLHNWATTDYATIDTVVMSQFQRTYRGVVNQQKETRRMPTEVRQLIETADKTPYLLEKGDYE